MEAKNVPRKILITGAAGKVGQAFIKRLLAEPEFSKTTIRALCHSRKLAPSMRLEVVTGNMADAGDMQRAVAG